jgi:DNA-binding NtrC family response regulator
MKLLKTNADRVRIIVIDLKSSGMGGGGFLHQARKTAPHASILITAPLGPFLYQNGEFYDFHGSSLKKDINAILLSIIEKMDTSRKPDENTHPEREWKERFGVIIGASRSINGIYRLIEKLETSDATVLIQGESGTGKELVAQTIHKTGLRNDRPFVALNCGAIPANLVESELFGHERGAFTTALHQRKGKFEVAHGGTLFLDEIGELDSQIQVKLLRVLQEKEFQRVGGNRSFKTDVRVIAATNRNLKNAVKRGHFRDDLFYRLNVVPIHIPPLRERRGDIPLLLDHFFHKTADEAGQRTPFLTENAARLLINYPYPGNVRELANLVERLAITCSHEKITTRDLPEEVREAGDVASVSSEIIGSLPDGGVSLKEMERALILKTLEMTSGNKAAAARTLGITRRLLYLRLCQYGLSDDRKTSPEVTFETATAT